MMGDLDISKEEEETEADIDRIENTRLKWISAVNGLADELKAKRRSGLSKKMTSEEMKKLKKMLKFFKEDVHEADDIVAVEMEEEFHKKKKEASSSQNKTSEKKLVFKEGILSPDVIHQMFGDVLEDMTQSKVQVTQKSHFTHIDDSDCLYRIIPLANNEALVSRLNDKHIDHVDVTGKVIQKLHGYSGNFIMLDNDSIFTGFGPMIIRRITPSGTQSEVCSTAPLHPAGVSISFNGDLLVTLCSCNVSKISSDSYGEVHQIEKSGVVQRRYTHTEDHRSKLFVNPLKVTQNVNKDLCVVDVIDNEFRSRLVVLSESSKLRFIYKGQQSFSKKFTSNDVACDDRGRILVTDYYNHAVHVLLEDGHFLQYLLTEQSPLSYPRSLGLHGDTLWVGCDKGVVRVYKYGEQ